MSPRLELPPELLSPISEDSPAGDEIRYEPVYDQIKVARTAEDDLPQGDWKREVKQADHAAVIRLAQDALATRSKDLQVAAWLTEALIHEHGFAGLAAGFWLTRELLERFWETAYPEIEDDDVEFRATPLVWMASYLDGPAKAVPLNKRGHTLWDQQQARALGYEADVADDYDRAQARAAALSEGRLAPEQFDAAVADTPKQFYKEMVADIAEGLGEVAALEAFCDERLGEFAPSFRPLREAVEEVLRHAERILKQKLEIDPDPPEEQDVLADDAGAIGMASVAAGGPAPGRAAGSGAGSATGGGAARGAAPQSAAEAGEWIATAARFLRKASPLDPASYLMLRGLRWGELRAGGGSVDPRLLEAPPTHVRTRLKSLLLDGSWTQLLDQAEEVMATPFGRGWLDLQRYALTACGELGDEYEPVARAMASALHSLLRDVPDLPMMTLMDDSPTANRETLAWLRDMGALDVGEEESGPVAPALPSRARSGGANVLKQALARVSAGRPQEGVQLLMNAAEQARSTRDLFLRRSDAAEIMVQQGMATVALPILEELAELVDRHALDDWEEGEVVARTLGLLYRSKLASGEEEYAVAELYQRVCRLDPMEGMKLASGGGSASAGHPYAQETQDDEAEYDSGSYGDDSDEY